MRTAQFTSLRILAGLAAAAAILAAHESPARATFCADPYIFAPRPNCQWVREICNWACPGYTGPEVTVQVLQPPTTASSVELNLLNICDSSPHSCSPPVTVTLSGTAASHCQRLAAAVSSADCVAAGFTVSSNRCLDTAAYFTVRNVQCAADSIVGVSTSGVFGIFDQTYLGALTDGEVDRVTSTPPPAPVPALGYWALALFGGGVVTVAIRRLRRSIRA